jgi:HAD superfamily phosphoserine phosphatase-like hydrolase
VTVRQSPAFASVVIDVDSTLCGVEGIDFLAERRGAAVRDEIVALTEKAMKGEIHLEAVYEQRLRMIQPTMGDLVALTDAYAATLAPGAAEAIDMMRRAGARVVLVSGGIREAIAPVALQLGFAEDELFAVSLVFSASEKFVGVKAPAPLATQQGKPEVVSALVERGKLRRPLLAVGDGATDAMLVGVVDKFAAYIGFARRETVVARADMEIGSFAELAGVVCGEQGRPARG